MATLSYAEPSFTIGIEEEYLLVARGAGDLVTEQPPGLLSACEARLPGQVSPEFLCSQLEVATPRYTITWPACGRI